MSGEDDDETLIASKDWLPPQPSRPRPAAGGAPQGGYLGAGHTQPMAHAAKVPEASAPAPSAPSAAESLAAGEGAFGTPPFVMTFLIVCGVLTALGLIALIYLEM
jgi:hypothetical protein